MEYDPTRPKWTQIADVNRERIASGEYPLHHLISEVRMEQEFNVARITVRKVTAALRKEGLIVTTPGMGSYEALTDTPAAFAAPGGNVGQAHGR